MLQRVAEASGLDEDVVTKVATLVLRELHLVARVDERSTSAAFMETCWNFGSEACYHLGGFMLFHDDPHFLRAGRTPDSEMPEMMKRMLSGDETIPDIRARFEALVNEYEVHIEP